MNKTFKNSLLEYAKFLGIPFVGIAGDGATYSKAVCLFPYFTGKKNMGNLSMYAYGKDYHAICADFLLKIADFIKEHFPSAKTEIHVDKGEGNDKEAAYLAGLGFYGKNTLLINETFGSFVFIGYVETDVILPPDSPLSAKCLGCGKCEKACPGGALKDGKLDETKCASHISQKKGELSKEETEILKKSGLIWGCDTCQTVCPHNAATKITPIRAFSENHIYSLSYQDETNKEFLELYKDRAFSWRGKSVINRNLEVLSLHETKNDGHTI